MHHPQYKKDPWYAGIFMATLMTAARPGEMNGLRFSDWDRKNNTISISRTGRHENRTKTEGSVRTLPVLPEAEEVFKYMEKIGPGKGYIFSPDGEQQIDPSAASAKLKRWLKEAGIKKDIHWHGLRGSAGSYMLENGMSIDDVSALMGHSNIGVTQKFYLSGRRPPPL